MMCGEEDFLFRKGSKVVLNARKNFELSERFEKIIGLRKFL